MTTFVGAGFFSLLCVLGAVSVLWLLVYVARTTRADRMSEAGGLDRLDRLRWQSWTVLIGWPPWTCWRGCKDLHGEQWWRAYLYRTCWDGCRDLHGEQWWRAYVDPSDWCGERPTGPEASTHGEHLTVISDDLARDRFAEPSSLAELIG
jgi:hypothetical protein